MSTVMIDNFDLISKFLTFNSPDEFYFVQIIQRKKDFKDEEHPLGTNNNNRLIKAYYVFSVEQLMKYKEEIISLCNLFKARAGISLNKRNVKAVALEMLELLARDIRVGNYNCISKIYNSVCGQNKSSDKLWIVDLDSKNIEDIQNTVDTITSIEPIGDKIKIFVPTKAGWHLITSAFNSQKFSEKCKWEIHKNNPTLLYFNEI